MKQLRRNRLSGFTLVELLVVIGIIALLISILLPSLSKARETANRAKCASNLRQIGQAMQLYANENNGAFPRGMYNGGAGTVLGRQVDITQNNNHVDVFATNATYNIVSQEIWLLLRNEDLVSAVFTCPSANWEQDKYTAPGMTIHTPLGQANFSTTVNLAYSIECAYPSTVAGGAVDQGWKWTTAAWTADMALMSDLNPGGGGASGGITMIQVTSTSSSKDQQNANSTNHQRQGQNVLYGDGHVDFNQNMFCGASQDPIFEPNNFVNGVPVFIPATSPNGQQAPLGAKDSILEPVQGT